MSWDRDVFEAGGGDASLLYVVFGSFGEELNVSAKRHRTRGLPDGLVLGRYERAQFGSVWDTFANGVLGKLLRDERPELADAVEKTPTCYLVRGEVRDPSTLGYLRDTIGILTAAFEGGGVALLDGWAFRWWSPEEWRRAVFEPDEARPNQHVTILTSPEEDGRTTWYHTRGLRKFGRPDLSFKRVPQENEAGAIDLFERLINMQARGARIPEGQGVNMGGLPEGLTLHHGGDLEDPDFNNVHIEVRRPS